MKMSQEAVEKLLRENSEAIKRADATSAQITKTLQRSRQIDRVVMPRLLRKGVVR
jgi:hypothetical protein